MAEEGSTNPIGSPRAKERDPPPVPEELKKKKQAAQEQKKGRPENESGATADLQTTHRDQWVLGSPIEGQSRAKIYGRKTRFVPKIPFTGELGPRKSGGRLQGLWGVKGRRATSISKSIECVPEDSAALKAETLSDGLGKQEKSRHRRVET